MDRFRSSCGVLEHRFRLVAGGFGVAFQDGVDLGDEARDLFSSFPGIKVIDDLANGKYPKPSDCDGDDAVFIGRIREDLSCDNGLAFWCVSDNLRKGAATNAVQIAELLVRSPAAVTK